MIRIHIDPKLRPVVNLFVEAYWWFTTRGLHPLAPYWRTAVIRRAELRSPSRPNRRLS